MSEQETQTLPPSTDDALSSSNVPVEEVGLSVSTEDALKQAQEELSQPTELPEQYKQYADIDWDLIPEESREGVLQGVKKMHGGLTRDHQELAEFRKAVPDLQRKAEALEWLWEQPWFKESYEKSQQPQASAPPEPRPDLSEHLGDDTSKAIQEAIDAGVNQRVGAMQEQFKDLQQRVVAFETEKAVNQLADEAKKKGWPDPRTKIPEIEAALRSGRARDLRTAYREAVFEEIPEIVKSKALEEYEARLKKNAEITVPPGGGPTNASAIEQFSGPDCVAKAVASSLRELNRKR